MSSAELADWLAATGWEEHPDLNGGSRAFSRPLPGVAVGPLPADDAESDATLEVFLAGGGWQELTLDVRAKDGPLMAEVQLFGGYGGLTRGRVEAALAAFGH